MLLKREQVVRFCSILFQRSILLCSRRRVQYWFSYSIFGVFLQVASSSLNQKSYWNVVISAPESKGRQKYELFLIELKCAISRRGLSTSFYSSLSQRMSSNKFVIWILIAGWIVNWNFADCREKLFRQFWPSNVYLETRQNVSCLSFGLGWWSNESGILIASDEHFRVFALTNFIISCAHLTHDRLPLCCVCFVISNGNSFRINT